MELRMKAAVCAVLSVALHSSCSSLSLTTTTSPVFGRVGGDVTLNFSLNPSNVVLQAVTWTVNNTNNVATCVGAAVSYGQGYEGRAHLNTMTGSLSLFRLTLRDSGQYSVSIITTEGETASGSVTLQVLDPVSVPTIQSNVTNHVEFNDTVTLTCTASGSDVSYRWFNGSSEVSDTQRIHLSTDNRTLTISGVLRSDDGPSYCYVYNHVSNGTSKPFSLDVKYGPDLPTLSVRPSKPVYAAGSSLILQCSAQSSPTAQYQWYLNGTSLNKRDQELKIRNIQAGNYTCWAFNDVTLRYAAAHSVFEVIASSPGTVFTLTTESLAGTIIGSFLGGVLVSVIAFLIANSIRMGQLSGKVPDVKADINESPPSTYENVHNMKTMDNGPSLPSPSTDHHYMGLQPGKQSIYHSLQGQMPA